MPITSPTRRWLFENGYLNLCFISYPRTGETEMTEFVERVQKAIQNEFKYQVSQPNVFIDTAHIAPGAIWPEHLKNNLKASIAMVAILSQIYFSDEHEWCGKEWGAMARLGSLRLPAPHLQPIIPLLFRDTALPPSAAVRQSIDLSRSQILGPRYFSTNEFRVGIQKVVRQIEAIAEQIYANGCKANAHEIEWPVGSPFVNDFISPQPAPLRSGSPVPLYGLTTTGAS